LYVFVFSPLFAAHLYGMPMSREQLHSASA
jgi:hypothetical protein